MVDATYVEKERYLKDQIGTFGSFSVIICDWVHPSRGEWGWFVSMIPWCRGVHSQKDGFSIVIRPSRSRRSVETITTRFQWPIHAPSHSRSLPASHWWDRALQAHSSGYFPPSTPSSVGWSLLTWEKLGLANARIDWPIRLWCFGQAEATRRRPDEPLRRPRGYNRRERRDWAKHLEWGSKDYRCEWGSIQRPRHDAEQENLGCLEIGGGPLHRMV